MKFLILAATTLCACNLASAFVQMPNFQVPVVNENQQLSPKFVQPIVEAAQNGCGTPDVGFSTCLNVVLTALQLPMTGLNPPRVLPTAAKLFTAWMAVMKSTNGTQKLCSWFNTLKTCAAAAKGSSCMNTKYLTYHGIPYNTQNTNQQTFLTFYYYNMQACTPANLPVVKKNMKCLINSLQPSYARVKKCKPVIQATMTQAQLCKTFQKFSDCWYKGVASDCNSKAAGKFECGVANQVMQNSNQLTGCSFKCNAPKSADKRSVSVVLMLVAAAFAMVVKS